MNYEFRSYFLCVLAGTLLSRGVLDCFILLHPRGQYLLNAAVTACPDELMTASKHKHILVLSTAADLRQNTQKIKFERMVVSVIHHDQHSPRLDPQQSSGMFLPPLHPAVGVIALSSPATVPRAHPRTRGPCYRRISSVAVGAVR